MALLKLLEINIDVGKAGTGRSGSLRLCTLYVRITLRSLLVCTMYLKVPSSWPDYLFQDMYWRTTVDGI